MGDDDVRPCVCHLLGLVGVERVGRREQIHVSGEADELDFLVIPHARLFEVRPKHAVDQSHRGKVLHACKARLFHLLQEAVHEAERF